MALTNNGGPTLQSMGGLQARVNHAVEIRYEDTD